MEQNTLTKKMVVPDFDLDVDVDVANVNSDPKISVKKQCNDLEHLYEYKPPCYDPAPPAPEDHKAGSSAASKSGQNL